LSSIWPSCHPLLLSAYRPIIAIIFKPTLQMCLFNSYSRMHVWTKFSSMPRKSIHTLRNGVHNWSNDWDDKSASKLNFSTGSMPDKSAETCGTLQAIPTPDLRDFSRTHWFSRGTGKVKGYRSPRLFCIASTGPLYSKAIELHQPCPYQINSVSDQCGIIMTNNMENTSAIDFFSMRNHYSWFIVI
jgi:hypothetical protein